MKRTSAITNRAATETENWVKVYWQQVERQRHKEEEREWWEITGRKIWRWEQRRNVNRAREKEGERQTYRWGNGGEDSMVGRHGGPQTSACLSVIIHSSFLHSSVWISVLSLPLGCISQSDSGKDESLKEISSSRRFSLKDDVFHHLKFQHLSLKKKESHHHKKDTFPHNVQQMCLIQLSYCMHSDTSLTG